MSQDIHRKLARILAVSAVTLSIVVGGTVLTFGLLAKEHAIASLALSEAAVFISQLSAHFAGGTADHREIETALANLLRERAHLADGHFVAARVYSANGKVIAEEQAADGFSTLMLPALGRQELEDTRATTHHLLFKSGEVYVRTIAFIAGIAGGSGGFFEGVYLVDQATLRRLVGAALAAMGVCVAAIVANTGFLYPMMVSLNRRLVGLSRDLLDANVSMLEVLGNAIAMRDGETGHHNYRVTLYAASLGEAIHLPPDDMRRLVKGAFLHDVGKIAVSDTILLKPGALTDAEFEQIRTHVGHGLDVVRGSKWLADAEAVVGGHHEKWDGTGYPRGLKGESIPLLARVFAIADVFDALTSRRPYKPPMSFEDAWTTLERGRGAHFDPALLDIFQRIGRGIHARVADRADDELKALLAVTIGKYFH